MLKPSLQLRLGQQLTMTPQLQQAIRLLQLPALELQAHIRELLESNVMLEPMEDTEGTGVFEAVEEPSALLRRVCLRRARVLADPGWIAVHFSLEDVSTDIRRAGLDLDPGYVPWLGVVVRFVYD